MTNLKFGTFQKVAGGNFWTVYVFDTNRIIIIIIIMAGMAVFNVAGYLIEERRRWPVITASPRGQCSK